MLEHAVAVTDAASQVKVMRDAVTLERLAPGDFPLPDGYLLAAAQLDDGCELRPRLFRDGACVP